MNKHVKRVLLYSSGVACGFVIGGVYTVVKILEKDYVRKAISYHIADHIINSKDYKFDEVIFDSRDTAEQVLQHMNSIVDDYGVVTVEDLYNLAALNISHTAHKYGWTDLSNVKVVTCKHGYCLTLPKPRIVY